eukprot:5178735-Amphidinium_carterae.1
MAALGWCVLPIQVGAHGAVDAMSEDLWSQLRGWVRSHLVQGVGLRCIDWTWGVHASTHTGAALREPRNLWHSGASWTEQSCVATGNTLARAALSLFFTCRRFRCPVLLESSSSSKFWWLPLHRRMQQMVRVDTITAFVNPRQHYQVPLTLMHSSLDLHSAQISRRVIAKISRTAIAQISRTAIAQISRPVIAQISRPAIAQISRPAIAQISRRAIAKAFEYSDRARPGHSFQRSQERPKPGNKLDWLDWRAPAGVGESKQTDQKGWT